MTYFLMIWLWICYEFTMLIHKLCIPFEWYFYLDTWVEIWIQKKVNFDRLLSILTSLNRKITKKRQSVQNQNVRVSIELLKQFIWLIRLIKSNLTHIFSPLLSSSLFPLLCTSRFRFSICVLDYTCFSANAFDVQFICNAFLFDARKGLTS